MSVKGEMPLIILHPNVFLINLDPDQSPEDDRDAFIMIAFDPDHFNALLMGRKFQDIGEKFPVLVLQTIEVEVNENVAEENQAVETIPLKDGQKFFSAT